ncbi:glutaminase liver isoform, mitochondrial isoform X3 [Lepeophtheirus salmonis]|nr:glutaminase liver isoform, mitochondrial-like isoform X3 [Lepeophtheirus salmonis]XP_040578076.1 glutaminase liver isoform, mitochondrial-like isoform X3 [Lepeophtheirus salmonis]XP_040578077.1 glutaminase liver isoform, mitochondrial-like isoform X3 [Lepeophtheirus salmonis]
MEGTELLDCDKEIVCIAQNDNQQQETSNSAIENEEETNIDSQAKSYGDIFINSPSSNFEHIYTSRTSCEGSNLIQSSKEGIFDNGHKIRMASGKNSSKGSCCSTPISSVSRAEIAYPSPNFIRPAIYSVEQESCDENSKLTIKLHYNPVMDEWVSLTENESLIPEEVINYQESIMLFDMHKIEINNGTEEIVNVGKFLAALEETGLRRNDPRLQSLMKELDHIKRSNEECGTSIEGLQLDKETFIRVIKNNLTLIIRAFKNQLVIPEFGVFGREIEKVYEKLRNINRGEVASYIPQLARYDANYWGISICTVDGQRLSVGDTNIPFTLQSCSKPFTYAVCLNELGSEVVHQYVGQEPSGKMFNELSLDKNNKPHNPLLNSGAIMSSAILLNLIHPEMKMSEKFDYVLEYLRKMAGGESIGFNNSVFLSERDTADRNYALAYYMKEKKCFPKGFELQNCLDFYFQTCSMEVTCETVAVMAASLANGGKCPTTEEDTLNPDSVRDVLSLMHSCGMYNYSGEFAFNVGLPAKSGVSGALVLVIPNIMGIALWSPPLDSLGNTVRSVDFSQELVKIFNFHRFDNLINKETVRIDPRKYTNEVRWTSMIALLYSATTGDLTALKRCYFNDINMSLSNYDNRTALHLSAAEGHLECTEFLVEKCNLDPLTKDRWGYTPLSEAKRFEHEMVYRYLVKHCEDNCLDDLIASLT